MPWPRCRRRVWGAQQHPVPLLAKADELEARLRLALGDVRGAEHVGSRLPEERRRVVSAIIA